jgi:hypothetical protein
MKTKTMVTTKIKSPVKRDNKGKNQYAIRGRFMKCDTCTIAAESYCRKVPSETCGYVRDTFISISMGNTISIPKLRSKK